MTSKPPVLVFDKLVEIFALLAVGFTYIGLVVGLGMFVLGALVALGAVSPLFFAPAVPDLFADMWAPSTRKLENIATFGGGLLMVGVGAFLACWCFNRVWTWFHRRNSQARTRSMA